MSSVCLGTRNESASHDCGEVVIVRAYHFKYPQRKSGLRRDRSCPLAAAGGSPGDREHGAGWGAGSQGCRRLSDITRMFTLLHPPTHTHRPSWALVPTSSYCAGEIPGPRVTILRPLLTEAIPALSRLHFNALHTLTLLVVSLGTLLA